MTFRISLDGIMNCIDNPATHLHDGIGQCEFSVNRGP